MDARSLLSIGIREFAEAVTFRYGDRFEFPLRSELRSQPAIKLVSEYSQRVEYSPKTNWARIWLEFEGGLSSTFKLPILLGLDQSVAAPPALLDGMYPREIRAFDACLSSPNWLEQALDVLAARLTRNQFGQFLDRTARILHERHTLWGMGYQLLPSADESSSSSRCLAKYRAQIDLTRDSVNTQAVECQLSEVYWHADFYRQDEEGSTAHLMILVPAISRIFRLDKWGTEELAKDLTQFDWTKLNEQQNRICSPTA